MQRDVSHGPEDLTHFVDNGAEERYIRVSHGGAHPLLERPRHHGTGCPVPVCLLGGPSLMAVPGPRKWTNHGSVDSHMPPQPTESSHPGRRLDQCDVLSVVVISDAAAPSASPAPTSSPSSPQHPRHRSTMITALAGATVGCVAAWGTNLATGYQTPADFTTAVGVLAVLVDTLAALPPAAHAARLDPVNVMRTPMNPTHAPLLTTSRSGYFGDLAETPPRPDVAR